MEISKLDFLNGINIILCMINGYGIDCLVICGSLMFKKYLSISA